MKKLIISMLLLVTATMANAQQRDEENFSKRLFEARLAEMCLRLELTDSQKSKFTPIYEQYCNEMRELQIRPPHGGRIPQHPGMHPDRKGRPGKPGMKPDVRKPKDEHPNMNKNASTKPERKEQMSDADRVKTMKERMEKQKKAQDIRLAYTDKFATVLTDKQLVKFYEVESDIQEKLHRRAFNGRPHERR